MRKFLPFSLGFLCFFTAKAQYCTSGGPSSTVDSNVQLVRIIGQGDSIHHIGCPGVIGVQNLSSESVTVVANTAYTLQVQFGTCNGNYLGSGEVWIDYDQSGAFDAWESVGTWTGTPPVPLSSFNVLIPASAQNGSTRMRVMQREGNLTPPLDPCGAFNWGSVMDFTVNITGGVDCSAYTGDDTSDPILVTSYPYSHSWDNSYCYGNQNPVYASPDVYYRITPSSACASMTASLCGSSFDTFLSVIDASGNLVAYNDDGPNCAPQSELTFSTVGLDTAFIIVEGWGTNMGAYTLNITQNLVGINEMQAPDFHLFPNPAGSQFSISGLLDSDVLITDLSGKEVKLVRNYQGGDISLSGLPAGAYIVRFWYNGISYSEKLIVSQ